MDFYQANLAAFAILNVGIHYQQHHTRSHQSYLTAELKDAGKKHAAREFQHCFLVVYVLAVAADWLQASHSLPVSMLS